MNIQWFPGHMAKTKRIVAESLKLVDVVIELLDARIPRSSKNPDLDEIVKNRPRIIALNKSDLADRKISEEWAQWYAEKGLKCLFIDSIQGKGFNELKNEMRSLMRDKIEKEKQRGRIFRSIKTMVVGIPNVGKSSFINRIAGKAAAITGDKPGVTRGKQWIRINEEIELLDTPGILWPKFDDPRVGMNLAYTGAIKDDILDTVEVASSLIEFLSKAYPQNLRERFKLKDVDGMGHELLEAAGRNRGCIISGGEIDFMRISAIVLDEFRGGKIGRISLEKPPDREENKAEGGDGS
ncbi:MAG: ribosome biogenesis GTPase YlqF [Clostridiales bacterium]|jgi:ribosome biogenesis GTPase A|nr:ribosome biogenesis GTPase YlqF [Eubacteriales bacterium]MDH7565118.1 ribosome biogenesis GTPase YlqF [Clostridiales bacterium]